VAAKSKAAEIMFDLAESIAGTQKPAKTSKLSMSGFLQNLPLMKKK
jgi:hypothetical protein